MIGNHCLRPAIWRIWWVFVVQYFTLSEYIQVYLRYWHFPEASLNHRKYFFYTQSWISNESVKKSVVWPHGYITAAKNDWSLILSLIQFPIFKALPQTGLKRSQPLHLHFIGPTFGLWLLIGHQRKQPLSKLLVICQCWAILFCHRQFWAVFCSVRRR